ncbi:MAG: SPOR domain-containing protein [Paracoccaceae bacterium]|nr:SPOR domain-containing protein [Paracoccaceae bacterium]
MKTRAVVAGGLLVLAGVWAISAVGQAMLIVPAEYPPASYEGREYVDSNGCVFIRAGVDGTVNWVPRVSIDRKPVCGFEPTFSAQQLAALNAAEAETMAATAAPAALPTPTPVTTPAKTMTVASDPNVQNDIYTPIATNSGLSSGSNYGQSVATNVPGLVVNDIYVGNGGQSSAGASSVEVIYPSGTSATNYVRATTSNTASLSINVPNNYGDSPFGYKPAWDDGRINPQRGPQSSAGDASMNQVWTQTLPRQLLADASGYQRSGGGFGNTVRSVIPWMSSKELAPGSAGDFIQIGAFGSAENVGKNIAVLTQMGMGAVIQDAGAVQVVLAGPFSSTDIRSALRHLRSSGYSDAFVH